MRESWKISSPFEQRINRVFTFTLYLCLGRQPSLGSIGTNEWQTYSICLYPVICISLNCSRSPYSCFLYQITIDLLLEQSLLLKPRYRGSQASFLWFHVVKTFNQTKRDTLTQSSALSILLSIFIPTFTLGQYLKNCNIAVITDSDWGPGGVCRWLTLL